MNKNKNKKKINLTSTGWNCCYHLRIICASCLNFRLETIKPWLTIVWITFCVNLRNMSTVQQKKYLKNGFSEQKLSTNICQRLPHKWYHFQYVINTLHPQTTKFFHFKNKILNKYLKFIPFKNSNIKAMSVHQQTNQIWSGCNKGVINVAC